MPDEETEGEIVKMKRRGFLELMGKSAAIPAVAAVPVISSQVTADELSASYEFEMRRMVPEGYHDVKTIRAPGFHVSGVQPLDVILQELKNRSESKFQWVLTKLEPV